MSETDMNEATEAIEADETTIDEVVAVVDEVDVDEVIVDENGEIIEDFDDEEDEGPTIVSPFDKPGKWFVIHTYSGYENKVKGNLENVIVSRAMEDSVFEIVIPMEDVVEFKGGKKVTVSKKVFPGYILIRTFLDDEVWAAVKGTPGVTGFVGPTGAKPVPLPRDEVEGILGVEVIGGEAPVSTKRSRPRLEYEIN